MELILSDPQMDAFESSYDHKFTGFVGGVGSGKTFLGSAFAMTQISESNSPGLVVANTHTQLKDVCMPAFLQMLDNAGMSYHKSGMDITTHGTVVHFRSAIGHVNWKGVEAGWLWGDEAAYWPIEAFETAMARLRHSGHPQLRGMLTTTPAGFNWVYDYFHPSGEFNDPEEFNLVKAVTSTNTALPAGYFETLKRQYGEKLALQELYGEFTNLQSGRVYWAFDREIQVRPTIVNPNGSILIGMDFNVDPMTAVICQVENDKILVHAEIFLRDSNTPHMCQELMKLGLAGASVIPDSTGKNRKTSGRSDFEILRENFTILPTHNPFVNDRVNNLNRLLSQGRLIINPSCKKLINDLERVSWKGNEIDKTSEKLLSHISDSLGYVCWKIFPIKRDVKKFHTQAR